MIAKWLLQNTIWLAIFAALLLVPAGTLHWPAAWVFLGAMALTSLVFALWLAKNDPRGAWHYRRSLRCSLQFARASRKLR